MRTRSFVTISGFVKDPDTYPLAIAMTLKDLILAADDFTYGAFPVEAEVSRMLDPLERTNVTAHMPVAVARRDGTAALAVERWTVAHGCARRR